MFIRTTDNQIINSRNFRLCPEFPGIMAGNRILFVAASIAEAEFVFEETQSALISKEKFLDLRKVRKKFQKKNCS